VGAGEHGSKTAESLLEEPELLGMINGSTDRAKQAGSGRGTSFSCFQLFFCWLCSLREI